MILDGFGLEGAKNVLLSTDPKINIIGVDQIFYPYVWVRYSVFVGKGRLSKLNKMYDCIIDGVSGSTYQGKGSPTMVDAEIEEKDTLGMQITTEKVYKTGHDFVMKLFLGKAKLLMTPVIEAIKEEMFYKKFYIMHCLDDQEQDYFIMVDSVDGGLSVLDYKG